MGKIGRNQPCPCGSGLKYKKCCIQKEAEAGVAKEVVQVSLNDEVGKIQQAASEGRKEVRALGVFILFASETGDAWLLEISEMDAIQLVAGQQIIDVNIVENPQTIEVDWSHTFLVKDNKFVTTAYKDKKVDSYSDYPAKEIRTAIKKIRKSFSAAQLSQVHISEQTLDSEE